MLSYSLFLKRFSHISLTLVLLTGLPAGCGFIYVPDVQQGNMIKAENVARIKAGMTQQQVRFVLGTPLIQDPFHKDRWDYHYSYRNGDSGETEIQHAAIYFANGKVVRIIRNLKTAPVRSEE